ncbi:Asp-tRNA(Asn)/Glu-tRNA(Gln) amidotransferase subunit GatB [soil metagenome]
MTSAGIDTSAWEMVVGLEVHVQLRTRTKAFCCCATDFGAPPNVNTCPVCLALPGALPVLNAKAVELAARAALALNCNVHTTSVFARKNYFYPDSPKGYQISQFDQPLASAGYLDIGTRVDASTIRIGITRVHMEEDAGKSVHDRYRGASAIDLNRSGTPLIEIVSAPDLRSPEQAGAYLRVLKQILEYIDVSDVNMEQGSLRVDANVSARRHGETALGTKTELKNLNSFSGVERALAVEFKRHVRVLASGRTILQQTMLWDANTGEVRPSRTKEGSHDYRYFPEPDLPPLILSIAWIAKMTHDLPELPEARRQRFVAEYGLGAYDLDVLTANPRVSDYYESVARAHGDAKTSANWVMGEVLAYLKANALDISGFAIRPADLAQLLDLVRDGVISHTAAKQVFARMVLSGDPPAQIAEREGLIKVDDDALLAGWIDDVIAEMPDEAERFRKGEKRLQGVLIGAAMKKSKGRADPRKLNQLLDTRLGS